jgi:hypothetical protein
LNEQAQRERPTGGRLSSAPNGRVHLKAAELPRGRLIVRCSKHTTAVIDRIIHDTYDPSRNGTRCVYGYFTKGTAANVV